MIGSPEDGNMNHGQIGIETAGKKRKKIK